jgi:aminopeptidase N
MKFRRPKMSTYLMAMAVGDFRVSSAAEAVPLRLRDAGQEGSRTARPRHDREILTFLNGYYDIKYRSELDLVAIQTAAGAMETRPRSLPRTDRWPTTRPRRWGRTKASRP